MELGIGKIETTHSFQHSGSTPANAASRQVFRQARQKTRAIFRPVFAFLFKLDNVRANKPVSREVIPLLDPPYIVRLIVKKGSSTSYVIKSNVEYDTVSGSKAKSEGIDKIKKIHVIDGWRDFPVPKEKKHLDICYPFFHEFVKNPIRYRNWFLTYRPNTVRGAIIRPEITWDASFEEENVVVS